MIQTARASLLMLYMNPKRNCKKKEEEADTKAVAEGASRELLRQQDQFELVCRAVVSGNYRNIYRAENRQGTIKAS